MCTREELEAHFQAAKEYALVRKEIAALRKQGVRPGEAYSHIVDSRSNPLLSRYYAPTLYAYAMTAPVEPGQKEETPALDRQPVQELQDDVTVTAAALPGGETSEQTENTPIGVSEITPVYVSQVDEI